MNRPTHCTSSPLIGLIITVITAITTTVAPAQRTDVYDLRPHFVEGRTARYEIWTRRDQWITVSVGARSTESTNTLQVTGEVTWQVQRVNSDGSATCIMTYDWLRIELTDHEGNQRVSDSRKPQGEVEALHKLVTAMVGSPLRMAVDPDGSVRDVQGQNAIKNALGDATALMPDDRDFIESATDLAMIAATPQALTTDESWTTDFNWSHQFGQLHQNMTYTLESVEPVADVSIAIVQAEATMTMTPKPIDAPSTAPPVDIRMTFGSIEGQIMFDLLRHEAVGRNMLETRIIEINMTYQGRTFNRTIEERVHSQALRIDEN